MTNDKINALMALADAYAGPEHDSLSNARATLETALRAAIDAPEQEPVAVVDEGDDGLFADLVTSHGVVVKIGDKLYTNQEKVIGAVLTYTQAPATGACGNTIGANGGGDRAVIFRGSTCEVDAAIDEYLARPHMQRVRNRVLVTSHEQYAGNPITIIETAARHGETK